MITSSFSFLLLFSRSRGFAGRSFHTGGGNGSSMGYVHPDLAAFIAATFLIVVIYIVFRVWRSLKKEQAAKRTKKEEEAHALRQLYEDNFGDEDEMLF
jgi:hypothetical protein